VQAGHRVLGAWMGCTRACKMQSVCGVLGALLLPLRGWRHVSAHAYACRCTHIHVPKNMPRVQSRDRLAPLSSHAHDQVTDAHMGTHACAHTHERTRTHTHKPKLARVCAPGLLHLPTHKHMQNTDATARALTCTFRAPPRHDAHGHAPTPAQQPLRDSPPATAAAEARGTGGGQGWCGQWEGLPAA